MKKFAISKKNQAAEAKSPRIMFRSLTAGIAGVLLALPTRAATFADSDVAKGITNLVNDLTAWLLVLGPLVGALAAAYFLIRRAMADETDGKMWQKRAITAVICGVAVMLLSGLINILVGYFTTT